MCWDSNKINNNIFFLFFFASSSFCPTAEGQIWTWMKGDNSWPEKTINTYGTFQVPNINNKPCARYEACEWTDLEGNFWMYGGNTSIGGLMRNDLWKYIPSTNEWVWMHGSTAPNQPSVRGTQGIPDPSNTPGARGYGVASWVDKNGNLWMFGGSVSSTLGPNDAFDDLWMYDINTNEWKWVAGNLTGNGGPFFGSQGIPDDLNTPGARAEVPCSFVDKEGNFWLFSGDNTIGNFDDMWMFNTSTMLWTWISGSNSGTPQPPVYGNTFNALNTPGSRRAYTSWHDKDGFFWLFGGTSVIGAMNDLWKYDSDPTRNSFGQWMCINQSTPLRPRFEARARWIDDCSNLWILGGSAMNDLWKYNPKIDQWQLVSGDTSASNLAPTGNYGTKEVASTTNVPAGNVGALGWRNKDGLWLFGGAEASFNSNADLNNALWKFVPANINADFSASGCLGVSFSNKSTISGFDSILAFSWNFEDSLYTNDDTSSLKDPNYTYTNSQIYYPQLIAVSCVGLIDSVSIPVNDISAIINVKENATINEGESAVLSVSNCSNYFWSPSTGLSCTDCPSPIASPTATTVYSVFATDNFGCAGIDSVTITVKPSEILYIPNSFTPNDDGVNDVFLPKISTNQINRYEILIFNRWGEQIFSSMNINEGWTGTYRGIEAPVGIYNYQISYYLNETLVQNKGAVILLR